MRRSARTLLFLLFVSGFARIVPAVQSPVGVSPGSGSQLPTIAEPCPTFSWTQVSAAARYELVVYEVGATEGDSTEVARQALPAGAGSWTPSLDDCLEGGREYAWSIRAMVGEGASEWSAPRLFRVAPGPSVPELEAALAVVQAYLGTALPQTADPPADSSSVRSAAEIGTAAADGPSTRTHVGTGDAILVDGAVAETKADPPCHTQPGGAATADRFYDCDNGTVFDSSTGLLWLKNANCLFSFDPPDNGRRNWFAASAFAAILQEGLCGLTDHSQPGDWRLPSESEWALVHDPTCSPPELAGKSGGCYSSDVTNEWALSVLAASTSFYWSSTTDPSGTWQARGVSLGTGASAVGSKLFTQGSIWPVRPGQ